MTLGGTADRPRLLIFITPSCTSCSALAPDIHALWRNERKRLDFAIVFLYTSVDDEARRFIAKHELGALPATTEPIVGLDFNVISPPYAILLDNHGIVRTKGIANNLEHLESIVNVLHEGYSTMEEWFEKTSLAAPLDTREAGANS